MRNDIISSLAFKTICYILLRTWAEWCLDSRATCHIGIKSTTFEAKKRKEQRKKGGEEEARSSWKQKKKSMPYFWFPGRSTRGEDFEPDIFGIPQLETFSETLHLFTSKTDQACSRYLCRANSFAREAQEIVCDFCTWGWRNLQLSYRTVPKYKWFVWDSDWCCCKLCF